MEITARIPILPDVSLNYIKTQQFKTGFFSATLLRPLCREEAAMNTLLPEVLLRGSAKYPDMQAISNRLDDLYGAGLGSQSRRRGEVHMIGLYADFVDDRYTGGDPVLLPVIRTLFDIFLHPLTEDGVFSGEYVESEKVNLIRSIRAQINNKKSYANRRMAEHMFADEAYGVNRAGTEETVEAITAQSLFAHYQKILAQSRLELFYLGSEEGTVVADAVREALTDLPRSGSSEVGTRVIRRAEKTRYIAETMSVAQACLVMGFRTDCTGREPEWPAVIALNALFGGSVSSKLFLRVREELSLCYSIGSSIDRSKGVLIVSAGIAAENEELAKQEILAQLEECRAGHITQQELDAAKSWLLSVFRMYGDSPARWEELSLGSALGDSEPSFAAQAEKLLPVTVEQVREAATRLTLDTVYVLKGGPQDEAV